MSPALCIANRIGGTGEPCGTPASTGWLCRTLPSITIAAVLSERKLLVHRMRSPSVRLAFIASIGLFPDTLGNAALISITRSPVMLCWFHTEFALSTVIAAAAMADLILLSQTGHRFIVLFSRPRRRADRRLLSRLLFLCCQTKTMFRTILASFGPAFLVSKSPSRSRASKHLVDVVFGPTRL